MAGSIVSIINVVLITLLVQAFQADQDL